MQSLFFDASMACPAHSDLIFNVQLFFIKQIDNLLPYHDIGRVDVVDLLAYFAAI